MTQGQAVFLAFGKVSDTRSALRNEGAGIAAAGFSLGRQVALVTSGTPAFRLNSPGWMKVPPELIGVLNDRAQLRLLCRDRLSAAIPAFAAASRRWIDSYLDEAEARALQSDREAETLNDPADIYFETLLPIPSPHLALVELQAGQPRIIEDQDIIRLDLAFWDGESVTGVLFGDQNTTTPKESAALKQFGEITDPTVTIHRITTAADRDALKDKLLKSVSNRPGPWFGPYRPEEFRAPLP